MLVNNLGYPRIGTQRELKKACENYWSEKINHTELMHTARNLCKKHWLIQAEAGVDLIPCNDFSFYDQMLDMSMLLGVIPDRFTPVLTDVKGNKETDLYFAMARGYQKHGLDITALEMTKWFDTNYHYLVPEFKAKQEFRLFSQKVFEEFNGARETLQKTPKPVLIGPVTYLLLGKEKEKGFNRLDLLPRLLPVYAEILSKLADYGAEWVQIDEPILVQNLNDAEKAAIQSAFDFLKKNCPQLKILVCTYFEGLRDNAALALNLPVSALHIDLVRAPGQLDDLLNMAPAHLYLSLGLIDGRNIWKNNYHNSLQQLHKAISKLGKQRIMIAPSCSLLHCPMDLDFEVSLDTEIKQWLAFAKQKLTELDELRRIEEGATELLRQNEVAIQARSHSGKIHKAVVKERAASIKDTDAQRAHSFNIRQKEQKKTFRLPLYPTTTIGSFPQTGEVRQWRARLKKGALQPHDYEQLIKKEIEKAVRIQEELGLDVLVHGEFERNDMVEYFGEQLEGFAFTHNGWVQSYGSRCVKPPVIYGDVYRAQDMTVSWTQYAQSLTTRPLKGMLTGPVTILQWSFVRDDQPRSQTAYQIALAIRDEVIALEKAGIRIIQIDEPAIREGLPLRQEDRNDYLHWAVRAFRIAVCGVKDETQIHTHMCYAEFNDIIEHIAALDADVITIETSRSQMELLEAFAAFQYPNEIGPGVYDIHAPRIPSVEEMVLLLQKATTLLPRQNIWVNPDCGLKTRGWEETIAALSNMIQAAELLRTEKTVPSQESPV